MKGCLCFLWSGPGKGAKSSTSNPDDGKHHGAAIGDTQRRQQEGVPLQAHHPVSASSAPDPRQQPGAGSNSSRQLTQPPEQPHHQASPQAGQAPGMSFVPIIASPDVPAWLASVHQASAAAQLSQQGASAEALSRGQGLGQGRSRRSSGVDHSSGGTHSHGSVSPSLHTLAAISLANASGRRSKVRRHSACSMHSGTGGSVGGDRRATDSSGTVPAARGVLDSALARSAANYAQQLSGSGLAMGAGQRSRRRFSDTLDMSDKAVRAAVEAQDAAAAAAATADASVAEGSRQAAAGTQVPTEGKVGFERVPAKVPYASAAGGPGVECAAPKSLDSPGALRTAASNALSAVTTASAASGHVSPVSHPCSRVSSTTDIQSLGAAAAESPRPPQAPLRHRNSALGLVGSGSISSSGTLAPMLLKCATMPRNIRAEPRSATSAAGGGKPNASSSGHTPPASGGSSPRRKAFKMGISRTKSGELSAQQTAAAGAGEDKRSSRPSLFGLPPSLSLKWLLGSSGAIHAGNFPGLDSGSGHARVSHGGFGVDDIWGSGSGSFAKRRPSCLVPSSVGGLMSGHGGDDAGNPHHHGSISSNGRISSWQGFVSMGGSARFHPDGNVEVTGLPLAAMGRAPSRRISSMAPNSTGPLVTMQMLVQAASEARASPARGPANISSNGRFQTRLDMRTSPSGAPESGQGNLGSAASNPSNPDCTLSLMHPEIGPAAALLLGAPENERSTAQPIPGMRMLRKPLRRSQSSNLITSSSALPGASSPTPASTRPPPHPATATGAASPSGMAPSALMASGGAAGSALTKPQAWLRGLLRSTSEQQQWRTPPSSGSLAASRTKAQQLGGAPPPASPRAFMALALQARGSPTPGPLSSNSVLGSDTLHGSISTTSCRTSDAGQALDWQLGSGASSAVQDAEAALAEACAAALRRNESGTRPTATRAGMLLFSAAEMSIAEEVSGQHTSLAEDREGGSSRRHLRHLSRHGSLLDPASANTTGVFPVAGVQQRAAPPAQAPLADLEERPATFDYLLDMGGTQGAHKDSAACATGPSGSTVTLSETIMAPPDIPPAAPGPGPLFQAGTESTSTANASEFNRAFMAGLSSGFEAHSEEHGGSYDSEELNQVLADGRYSADVQYKYGGFSLLGRPT